MLDLYFQKLKKLLSLIEMKEKENLKIASVKVSQCIERNGIVHVFGCGHSHMLAEELFYRAGGLAAINPILIDDLMLHKGALRSSELEQQNNYAESFMKDVMIVPGDVAIIVSTSGRNPVPIDVAEIAKKQGAFTIAITSPGYAKSHVSRHKQGKYLYTAVDLVIDNHIEVGDTLMQHSSLDVSFSSGSSIAGMAIANGIMTEAISKMADHHYTPPIFKSGNADGAAEHNQHLIQRYKDRVPMLTTKIDEDQ
ncbi:SIS domain-containing protein [Bacillota bacterium Lsc_1132]